MLTTLWCGQGLTLYDIGMKILKSLHKRIYKHACCNNILIDYLPSIQWEQKENIIMCNFNFCSMISNPLSYHLLSFMLNVWHFTFIHYHYNFITFNGTFNCIIYKQKMTWILVWSNYQIMEWATICKNSSKAKLYWILQIAVLCYFQQLDPLMSVLPQIHQVAS